MTVEAVGRGYPKTAVTAVTAVTQKRIVPKAPVQMIISREYVGTQTVTEAFIPIISEDIRKKISISPEDEEKLYATLIDVCYENMSYDRQVDFWRHVLETNSLVCEVKE